MRNRTASNLCVAALMGVVLAAGPAWGQEAPAPPTDPSAAIFDDQVLQRVDLLMHSADWAKLKENFRENDYYPADLTWNGQTVRNIGIRSRGLGSRSSTKPGLRVDFDRYASDQEFLGLKSFVLDNLTQDQSGIHETVTMKLFARLGIPAPREVHTRLYVNNEYVGLYVIIESVDKNLLARVFGAIGDDTQNDGYLFEYNYLDEWRFEYPGDDMRWYRDHFSAKTHESKSDAEKFGPIEELVRLANQTREDRLPEAISGLLDLPGFIRYLAAQNFVAEADGFLGNWGLNNFYFYRLENRTQHVFIAWDEDVSYWGPTFPTNEGHDANILMAKLMRVPEYRAMYRAELVRAAEIAGERVGEITWLESEIRRQLDLIDTAMREDPLKPYSNGLFDAARSAMIQFTAQRISFVRCELERGVRQCG